MDRCCPGLPPKILVADKVGLSEQTSEYMAAHGCHFIVCSVWVLFINIEFFLNVRESFLAQAVLYKISIAIVSRLFSEIF